MSIFGIISSFAVQGLNLTSKYCTLHSVHIFSISATNLNKLRGVFFLLLCWGFCAQSHKQCTPNAFISVPLLMFFLHSHRFAWKRHVTKKQPLKMLQKCATLVHTYHFIWRRKFYRKSVWVTLLNQGAVKICMFYKKKNVWHWCCCCWWRWWW